MVALNAYDTRLEYIIQKFVPVLPIEALRYPEQISKFYLTLQNKPKSTSNYYAWPDPTTKTPSKSSLFAVIGQSSCSHDPFMLKDWLVPL